MTDLRAAAEQVWPMDCPKPQLVSLVGNISSDGSARLYNAVVRLAELSMRGISLALAGVYGLK
jgi:hypothetical protein